MINSLAIITNRNLVIIVVISLIHGKESDLKIYALKPHVGYFAVSTTGCYNLKEIKSARELVKTVRIKRKKCPLTPAHSFTSHMAQGSTLDKLIVDLTKPDDNFGVDFARIELRVQKMF